MKCQTVGCTRQSTWSLRRIADGKIFAACARCAEELLARTGWERV